MSASSEKTLSKSVWVRFDPTARKKPHVADEREVLDMNTMKPMVVEKDRKSNNEKEMMEEDEKEVTEKESALHVIPVRNTAGGPVNTGNGKAPAAKQQSVKKQDIGRYFMQPGFSVRERYRIIPVGEAEANRAHRKYSMYSYLYDPYLADLAVDIIESEDMKIEINKFLMSFMAEAGLSHKDVFPESPVQTVFSVKLAKLIKRARDNLSFIKNHAEPDPIGVKNEFHKMFQLDCLFMRGKRGTNDDKCHEILTMDASGVKYVYYDFSGEQVDIKEEEEELMTVGEVLEDDEKLDSVWTGYFDLFKQSAVAAMFNFASSFFYQRTNDFYGFDRALSNMYLNTEKAFSSGSAVSYLEDDPGYGDASNYNKALEMASTVVNFGLDSVSSYRGRVQNAILDGVVRYLYSGVERVLTGAAVSAAGPVGGVVAGAVTGAVGSRVASVWAAIKNGYESVDQNRDLSREMLVQDIYRERMRMDAEYRKEALELRREALDFRKETNRSRQYLEEVRLDYLRSKEMFRNTSRNIDYARRISEKIYDEMKKVMERQRRETIELRRKLRSRAAFDIDDKIKRLLKSNQIRMYLLAELRKNNFIKVDVIDHKLSDLGFAEKFFTGEYVSENGYLYLKFNAGKPTVYKHKLHYHLSYSDVTPDIARTFNEFVDRMMYLRDKLEDAELNMAEMVHAEQNSINENLMCIMEGLYRDNAQSAGLFKFDEYENLLEEGLSQLRVFYGDAMNELNAFSSLTSKINVYRKIYLRMQINFEIFCEMHIPFDWLVVSYKKEWLKCQAVVALMRERMKNVPIIWEDLSLVLEVGVYGKISNDFNVIQGMIRKKGRRPFFSLEELLSHDDWRQLFVSYCAKDYVVNKRHASLRTFGQSRYEAQQSNMTLFNLKNRINALIDETRMSVI